MSQPQAICLVCFSQDMDVDNDTGQMRCVACNTISQEYREENHDELAGVTMEKVRGRGLAGFIREKNVEYHRERESMAKHTAEAAAKSKPLSINQQASRLAEIYCEGYQQILQAQLRALAPRFGLPPELQEWVRGRFYEYVRHCGVLSPGWGRQALLAAQGRYASNVGKEEEGFRKYKRNREDLLAMVAGCQGAERGGRRRAGARAAGERRKRARMLSKGQVSPGRASVEPANAPGECGGAGEGEEWEELQEEQMWLEDDGDMWQNAVGGQHAEWYEEGAELASQADEDELWIHKLQQGKGGRRHSRLNVILLESLRSLGIILCQLGCHWFRSCVLPTDILHLARQGAVPYFSAWALLPPPPPPPHKSAADRLGLSNMALFKPSGLLSARFLEYGAALVASKLRLLPLPPVNTALISARFLRDLNLPAGKLLGPLLRFYEVLEPGDIVPAADLSALPTRVHVMAILVLLLKLMYGLDGRRASPGPGPGPASEPASTALPTDAAAPTSPLSGSGGEQQKARMEKGKAGCSAHQREGETESGAEGGGGTGGGGPAERVPSDARDLLRQIRIQRDTFALAPGAAALLFCDDARTKEELRCYLEYCRDVVFAEHKSAEAEGTEIEGLLWRCFSKPAPEPPPNPTTEPAGRGHEGPSAHVDEEESTRACGREAPGASTGPVADMWHFEMEKEFAATCRERAAGPVPGDTWHEMREPHGLAPPSLPATSGRAESAAAAAPELREVATSAAAADAEEEKEKGTRKRRRQGQGQEKASPKEKLVVRVRRSSSSLEEGKPGVRWLKRAANLLQFEILPPAQEAERPGAYVALEEARPYHLLAPLHAPYFEVLLVCAALIQVHPQSLHRAVCLYQACMLRAQAPVLAA
eukprot:jgi/Mesen1/5914/ME000030S05188